MPDTEGLTDNISTANQMGEFTEVCAQHARKSFKLRQIAKRLNCTGVMDNIQED
jgi:hypothetical protein